MIFIQNNLELSSDELLSLAHYDLEHERLDAALIKLKTAVLRNDEHGEKAKPVLAQLYARLGLLEKSQVLFEDFIGCHPECCHERFLLGVIYQDQGQRENSLVQWNAVLKISENYPPALYHKALSLLDAEQAEEAHTLLQQLIGTAPADNIYVEKANELFTSRGLNKFTQAVPGYESH